MSMPLRIRSIILQEDRTGMVKSMEATETIMLGITRELASLMVNSRVSQRLGSDEHIRSSGSSRRSNTAIVEDMKAVNMSKAREQTMGTAIKATREDPHLMVSRSSSNRLITTFAAEELQATTNRVLGYKRTMPTKLLQQTNNLAEQITNWPLC